MDNNRLHEIEEEMKKLEEQLKNVNNNHPTEVYTRIVGYHRNIENWNKGKKEEFKNRKTFKVGVKPNDFKTKN